MKTDKSNSSQRSSWQLWGAFTRKHMPAPGKYQAEVIAIRGTGAIIEIKVAKGRVVRFDCDMLYSMEQYKDLPPIE